jgi:hypothetical protein
MIDWTWSGFFVGLFAAPFICVFSYRLTLFLLEKTK